jgi:hypothetical protein
MKKQMFSVPDLAGAALSLTCPKCNVAMGRKPILVETWEDQGISLTGKQTYAVRSKELPGYCAACTRDLVKKRWLATIAMGLPLWLACLGMGMSGSGTFIAIIYGLYLLKKSAYGWGDYLFYGLDLQTNLASQVSPLRVNDASVKFPFGCLHSLLRFLLWFGIGFIALVAGDIMRAGTSPVVPETSTVQEESPAEAGEEFAEEINFETGIQDAYKNKDLTLFTRLIEKHPEKMGFRTKIAASVLHLATQFDDSRLIKKLLSKGLSKDARDSNNGFTPAHWAARDGKPIALQALLESSAPVDVLGKHGHTPLHIAILMKRRETTEVLLKHGADPGIRIPNGMDCVALCKGNQTLLKILEEYKKR